MKQFYLPIASCLFMLFSYGQTDTKPVWSAGDVYQSTKTATSSSQENIGYFKLTVASGTKKYHTEFYFNDMSTYGLDRGYDAAVFGSGAPAFAIYSKLMDPSQYPNTDFAIQSLPYLCLQTQVIIPISTNIAKDLHCSIKMSDSYLQPGIDIYLEDTYTHTMTLITTDTYLFTTPSALHGEGRFRIHVSNNQTLGTDHVVLEDLKISALKNQKTVTVKGIIREKTALRLFDLHGRLVAHKDLDATHHLNSMETNSINPGVYVATLQNRHQQVSQQIVIQ